MNPKQFIKSISTIPYRSLDKEFDFAINHQAEVTDELLGVLKETLVKTEQSDDYVAHHFAVIFLALFREQSAFPLIIDVLSNMETNIFFDDIESIPNVLASTYNGEVNLLYRLIENDEAYEFARVAALETLVVLVLTNQLERIDVINYFKKLISSPSLKEESDSDMDLWVIYHALLLHPVEIINDIRLRFYLIGQGIYFDFDEIITPPDFEAAMKGGADYIKETFIDKQNYHLVTNLQEEMKHWDWFSPKKDYFGTQLNIDLEPEATHKSAPQKEEDYPGEEGSDDYYFLGDDKHMRYCHEHYGDFNEAGLQSLQDKYDTDHIKRAASKVSELCWKLEGLKNDLDALRTAARDIIEGDKPWGKFYQVDDHGDIGDFASAVYENLSDVECSLGDISKHLAPLCRLMPIDEEYDDEPYHKTVDDWLDRPDGYHSETRYEF